MAWPVSVQVVQTPLDRRRIVHGRLQCHAAELRWAVSDCLCFGRCDRSRSSTLALVTEQSMALSPRRVPTFTRWSDPMLAIPKTDSMCVVQRTLHPEGVAQLIVPNKGVTRIFVMAEVHSDAQAAHTSQPYRALLAVSEAIVSHRDLPALFHELAGRLQQVVRSIPRPGPARGGDQHHAPARLGTCPATRTARSRSFFRRRRPGGVGVADPATAHHLERGRAEALATVAGTSAAVWGPELLLAAADHGPAAAGHAGVHVQAAGRLRRGGRGLPAARRQPGGRGRRERPGLPGDRAR